MKAIKIINLFVLVLLCQVVFAQNNDIVRSFNLRMDKSVAKGLDKVKTSKLVLYCARLALSLYPKNF